MRYALFLVAIFILMAVAVFFIDRYRHSTPLAEAPKGTLYDLSVNSISGEPVSLSDYRGKVLLIVNVASKCGFTPQYAQLEALYKKYKDKGLVILGFPANNFMGQEPGSNQEIASFCTTTYGVTFPMFEKVSVKGPDTAPLYKWLIAQSDSKVDVEWNFAKFVVSRDGKVVGRFAPKTSPEDAQLVDAIEQALKQ